MKYLDLFSGIGGFALGAYWAGMKFDNHYFSEVDPYCIELYQKRFPDAILLGDIRGIDGKTLMADTASRQGDRRENGWIITGGFPCQDISVAGNGAGIRGERSGLWFEYWRLIRDLRPRFAIMENVGMLIHRGLREVLASLAEIGYDAEWQDIRAEDMGAPHRRERIWIVAYPNGEHGKRRTEPQLTASPCRESRTEPDGVCEQVAGTDNTGGTLRREASGVGLFKIYAGQANCGTRQGTHPWATEPAICGVADGLPPELYGYEGRLANKSHQRIVRLRGLGNAIVPQIAELVFCQIKELL